MTTYCMRADGTATTKAQATGPLTDPSKCMPMSVHNAGTFAANDVIIVGDQGGVYRITGMIMPSDQVTYQPDSRRPVVSGAQIAANSSWSKTTGRTNVYQIPYDLDAQAAYPYGVLAMVWEEDVRLSEQTSIADVDSNPGSFYHDDTANIMYAHASDSSSMVLNGMTYELPAHGVCVDFNNKNGLTFLGINATKTMGDSNTAGGFSVEGEGNFISGLKTWDHRRHAFIFYVNADSCVAENIECVDSFYGASVTFYNTGTVNNVFRKSKVHNSAGSGNIYSHGNGSGNIISDNDIWNDEDYPDAAYLIQLSDSGHQVLNNRLWGKCPSTISIPSSEFSTGGLVFRGNIIDGSGTTDAVYGMLFRGVPGAIFSHNLIKNFSNTYTVCVRTGCSDFNAKNNVFVNAERFFLVESSSTTGFESDYNQGVPNARWGSWDGTPITALGDWQAASSQDAHSSDTDPKISDAGVLASDSPCIDAGVWDEGVNDGGEIFRGNRKIYGLPNIGPDQKTGSPSGGGTSSLMIEGQRSGAMILG